MHRESSLAIVPSASARARPAWLALLALLLVAFCLVVAAEPAPTPDPDAWTVIIANDTCPDVTWGNTEGQTRTNFAALIASHLDAMTATDAEAGPNRDHYNTATTLEVLWFLEQHPDRRTELFRRMREGRLVVSPFLCNTLWGFHSIEGALRALYPARRLERESGVINPIAHHIELPSLPWGVPTLLAGAGIRWVNLPFLDYDCTFSQLAVPPVFLHEGPDGSRVSVILDGFASGKANYVQGSFLLEHLPLLTHEWLPHYAGLDTAYPLRTVLASGTHGDTHASSAAQTPVFARAIRDFNAGGGDRPRLVNGTIAAFCREVDRAQERGRFLENLRGCFGHSWELWPVALARDAADLRRNERDFLAAESLIALAGCQRPELHENTRTDRQRAEWLWAMLSDHAWNGSDDANRRENARLRRVWNQEFQEINARLLERAWFALDLRPSPTRVTAFNPISVPRVGLLRRETFADSRLVTETGRTLPSQVVDESDGKRYLYFLTSPVGSFAFHSVAIEPPPTGSPPPVAQTRLKATPDSLESYFYRLRLDPATGGLASLVHLPTGTEVLPVGHRQTLGQTLYHDGADHPLEDLHTVVAALGPVLARLRTTGRAGDLVVTQEVTLYDDLDWVDIDVRIHLPPRTNEHRLCQFFPIAADPRDLHIETPAAVLRPRPQPEGDLLPGADTRRFAIQGFIGATLTNGASVIIAPHDAFALRLDLGAPAFEALGNDQNFRESTRNQAGESEFRFRYSLRVKSGPFVAADAIAWSRAVTAPWITVAGRLPDRASFLPTLAVDPARAIATCLKPADVEGAGCVLRLWETAGRSTPILVNATGFRQALQTDLLERDRQFADFQGRTIHCDVRARGLASLRLVR